MFGLLLFLKCFHWIAADRVEWVGFSLPLKCSNLSDHLSVMLQMDQIPNGPPALFHIRLTILFTLLWASNLLLLLVALEDVLTLGVSGMIVFVNEYTIMTITLGGIMAKYVINAYDARFTRGEEGRVWEGKSLIVFYVELVTGELVIL